MTQIGLFTIQIILLVLFYGFNINLPWWVLWLPTIVFSVIIIFIFVTYIISEI